MSRTRIIIGCSSAGRRRRNELITRAWNCIFDEITSNYRIREGIIDGWLAPIMAYRLETEADVSKVRMQHGDFAVSDLASAINTPARNRLIVQKYAQLCPGKPGIFFTANIAHSEDLATTLREAGFNAAPATPLGTNARNLSATSRPAGFTL